MAHSRLQQTAWMGLVTASIFVIDKYGFELIPKPPLAVILATTGGAVALLAFAYGARFRRWLTARLPTPWFPRPFWRVGWWLTHRPRVAIVLASPFASADAPLIEDFGWDLTVNAHAPRKAGRAIFDFSRAELVMRQGSGGRARTFRFRCASLPLSATEGVAGGNAACERIRFEGLRRHIPRLEGPDMRRPYTLTLHGVRATADGARATLPATAWAWVDPTPKVVHEGVQEFQV